MTFDRWAIYVRGVNGDAEIFGVYGSESGAQRVADAVNRHLPQDTDSDAWSYVMPLYYATSVAEMVRRAVS